MQRMKQIPFFKIIERVRHFTVQTPLYGHRWYPDEVYLKDFTGVAMFPTPESSKYYRLFYHSKAKPVERKLQNMWINFGPQHPAAHGVLRMILELDGETVVRADPHLGFLHRATEKLMEYKHYNQNVPFFDRLDYVSNLYNELAYCSAVERLLNIEVPRRARAIRVMCGELTRIANHMLNLSGTILDAGGITPFFWMCEEREKLYEMFERLCGARIHCCYIRPGGVSQDLPIGYLDDVYELISKLRDRFDETEDLATNNRLFYARCAGIGIVTAQEAMSCGFTGPMLRATGVKWDIRINIPYEDYDLYDFEGVIGTFGDTYDRYLLRFEEMRQSLRILDQVINTIPEGEFKTDDSKICMPLRRDMKTSMESLIHHFKLCTEGYPVAPGSTYTAVECPKGEFGVYLVADGTSKPYRCHLRAASLTHVLGVAVTGVHLMLSDITMLIASIDVVLGDTDR